MSQTIEQLYSEAGAALGNAADLCKFNPNHDERGRFASGKGKGSGSNASPLKVGTGRYSYERKAAEAVSGNPHLDKLFNSKDGYNYAGNTSVWQQKYVGDRDKAIKATTALKNKAIALGFQQTKSGSLRHADGTKVDIALRKTSMSASGKVGSGVQITLTAPPKKKS